MAGTVRTISLKEARAMKDRGEVRPTRPDAAEIEMPEGFWDGARILVPRSADPARRPDGAGAPGKARRGAG